ncbi:diguanylate cyclase [Eubacteriaceae bacterium ES3]|nr:diguanylate cyclase [Eubacteriaceae bacterium ES3]
MLEQKFQKFMTNNYHFQQDDPQLKRVLMMNAILSLGIIIAFLFSGIAAYNKIYPVMVSNFIASLICALALYDFHRRHEIVFTAVVMILTEVGIITALVWFIGSAEYDLIWIIIVPPSAYFLLGRKGGRIFTVGIALLVLFYIILNYMDWLEQGYTFVSVLNLGFAYLVMTLIISYYERTVVEAFGHLEEKNNELASLSVTDKLTGAYNRIKLDEILCLEIENYQKTKRPFSVIIGDLDKFKEINDRLGHLAGDQVLKKTAEIMGVTIRENDICGRWGGEEFMIICPNTRLEGAAVLAEKLRHRIEMSEQGFPVTISIGVAQIRDEDTFESLVKRADDALYRGKSSGRNRVEYDKSAGVFGQGTVLEFEGL